VVEERELVELLEVEVEELELEELLEEEVEELELEELLEEEVEELELEELLEDKVEVTGVYVVDGDGDTDADELGVRVEVSRAVEETISDASAVVASAATVDELTTVSTPV
jgi:DNA-binding transcriptional regulator LsrR (DeoR family)